MSIDAGAASSGIEILNERTQGLGTSGSFNGTVGDTSPTTGAFTFVSQTAADALTAVGSSRTDALQLAAAINNVTGGDTGTGVILPDPIVGASVDVFNNSANAITVYAKGSQTIDGTAGATGVTLTNAKRCAYIALSTTAWLSAQLGAPSA